MRALCLSGGGDHGSYQVGVLKHLMIDKKRTYDVYTGISVGALNAALLSMFEHTESLKAIDTLEKMWLDITVKKVYKRWFPFGRLHGLWKQSFYNSAPLKDLIYSNLDPVKISRSGNKLVVGAISLSTGQYKTFNETYPDLADAIAASSAFPTMFCPVKLEGDLWLDGGIRNVTPLKDSIDLGVDEIDVVLTDPKNISPQSIDGIKTLNIAIRTLGVMYNETVENDIEVALAINEQVLAGKSNKKYIKINIIRPEKELSFGPLDFDPVKIKEAIQIGYVSAKSQSFK